LEVNPPDGRGLFPSAPQEEDTVVVVAVWAGALHRSPSILCPSYSSLLLLLFVVVVAAAAIVVVYVHRCASSIEWTINVVVVLFDVVPSRLIVVAVVGFLLR